MKLWLPFLQIFRMKQNSVYLFGLKDFLMKRTLLFFSLSLVMLVPSVLMAQTLTATDTTALKKPVAISLLNVSNELEQTQNRLVKISQNVKELDIQPDFDSLIGVHSHFLESEADDVNKVKAQTISNFYLENASRNWTGYQKRIKVAINDIRSQLSILQENIKSLTFEKEVWQLTLQNASEKADVPNELKSQINKMITQISKLKTTFEATQTKLILQENKLTDLLITTNDVLDKIQNLKKQMRANLFISSESVLWKSALKHSDIFPVANHLSNVWNINKKSISIYFVQKNFFLILLILLLETVAFIFLRNRYNKLGYNESNPGFVNANFVFNAKRVPSLLFIQLSTIIIVLQTIPLSISALLTMALLLVAIPLVSRFAGDKGKQQSMIIFFLFVFIILFLFFILSLQKIMIYNLRIIF